MNFDLILAVIFYLLILLFYLKNKKKFDVQGKIFLLYKTKLGLKLMDKIASKPSKNSKRFGLISLVLSVIILILFKSVLIFILLFILAIILIKPLRLIGFMGIIIGFLGMFFIFYYLIHATYKLIFVPEAIPALAPVLPGIEIIPGLPVLGFWHWIITILIVAAIHEFSHGIFARLYKIKIKSSGFAFLGPILAAFVEPDEKQLKKKPKKQQLAVFSAGPFSNLILGFLLFLFIPLIFSPIGSFISEPDGLVIQNIQINSSAYHAGVQSGTKIIGINNISTLNSISFFNEFQKHNNSFILNTDKGEFLIKPDGEHKLGVTLTEHLIPKHGTSQFILSMYLWIITLLKWLFMITIGIGLFNLLPLGPVDGGRMFYVTLLIFTKDEKKAKNIWSYVGFTCLALIVINLLPFIFKLLNFIFQPILNLF
ncbi:MAG: site-2 protease family protein [Nanoarchaeota archaeon]|nr:site-2 protease family protein [Nanoarchaeota archaeon]